MSKIIKIPAPKGLLKDLPTDPAKKIVIVSARRIGKTYQALRWLLKKAIECPNPEWENWYIAPFRKDAKRIAWIALKNLVPNELLKKTPNESELTITLKNGNRITLEGADRVGGNVGSSIYSAVFDEYGAMKSGIKGYLKASFKNTHGYELYLGTPRGGNHFKDLYDDCMSGKLPGYKVYPIYKTINSTFVTASEIEEDRAEMDPRLFRQEYEGSFETYAGLVYSDFARSINEHNETCNVLPTIDYNPNLDTYIGCDFGWNDETVLLLMQHDKGNGCWYIIDEIVSSYLQPETVADALYGKEVVIGGKPKQLLVGWEDCKAIIAGNEIDSRRQESNGKSMKSILTTTHGIPKARFRVKSHSIIDSIRSVRAKICAADGNRRLFVSEERCPRYIADKMAYHYPEKDGKPMGDKPDESPDNHKYSHTNDAERYVIHAITPIKTKAQWRNG